MASRYPIPDPIGSDQYDPPDFIFLGNPAGISAYADQQTDAANTFLLRLGDAVANLTPPVITPVFPDGPDAPAQITTELPEFTPVVWTAPSAPNQFTGVLDISDILPSPFTEDAPVLSFPTAPTFSVAVPDSPAVDLSFEMPTLSVTLPAAPDLLSLSVVPFDGMDIPVVDFEIPEMEIAEPSIREYTPGAAYTSALLSALQTSLQDRIENGGTGLNPDVENAIWDRGREREARSQREALDRLDQMEELGFTFPPGFYLDARLKIITETDYAERGLSREIMIKQAELEQANVQHALTTANALEGQLINYSNAVEQRLFESCKYATEAGIAIYNAKVQGYAALVDAYRGRVQIYEAQIRAEIAKVDAYRAQIEAEKAKADINRALVDQYRAQIDAALSSIRIFEAQVGAIVARAEIEKTKVMIFGEQVKAYGSQVQAYTAGVEGFRAQIQAEGVKQDAYKSRVEAYRAEVEAGVSVIQARIAAFKGNLDANVSQWQAYESAYRAESAKASAIAAGNGSLADAFRAEVAAVTSFNETLTKQWQVSLDQAQRVAEIGISAAKANAELYVTTRSLAVDAAKVGAQVSAQLGAAALNAINWSQSYSNSNSNAISTSFSNSLSLSTSQSESHNYNYSV
jgi:hypothetical protein